MLINLQMIERMLEREKTERERKQGSPHKQSHLLVKLSLTHSKKMGLKIVK